MRREPHARHAGGIGQIGGAAPVYVGEDADPDIYLPALVKGGFYHAGLVCVSVQRIFAPREAADALAERLAQASAGLKLGDSLDDTSEVGPMISEPAATRLRDCIDHVAAARVLTDVACSGDRFCAPTVPYDPPVDALVSTNEIFGPALCIYPVAGIEEAAARANALPLAFQALVFTSKLDKAMAAYRLFDASAVMVNDHTAFRVDWMPFAGLRQSGLGVGGMAHAIAEMSVERILMIRSGQLNALTLPLARWSFMAFANSSAPLVPKSQYLANSASSMSSTSSGSGPR